MLARYYSSGLGRFLSPDPSNNESDPENPQSWNRYTYVLNNPLRYTDPDGLETYLSIDEEPADYIEGKRGEVPGRTDFVAASAVFNTDTKQYDVTFKVQTLITTKPVEDMGVVLKEERDHQEQVREAIKETGNAHLDQKINNKAAELENKAEKKGWDNKKLNKKKAKMIKKTLKKASKQIKKLYNKKKDAYHKANK